MYVFAVVKWADGFSGIPRISPVLGRTVSGSTFRLHLSHLFLDLYLLLQLATTIYIYIYIYTPKGRRNRGRPMKKFVGKLKEAGTPKATLLHEIYLRMTMYNGFNIKSGKIITKIDNTNMENCERG